MGICLWCCCSKQNTLPCEQIVTKANQEVKCRRKMKHRISFGCDDPNAFPTLFKKCDKVHLCDFHYNEYVKQKEEFQKRFLHDKPQTKVSIDLSSSHDH